jgi:hypothetical protein
MTQPNIPTLGAPGAGGGLRLRSFGRDRLVLVLPQSRKTSTYDGVEKEELLCHVAALDGGPITFGGEANAAGGMKKPDTMIVEPGPFGWYAENVIIGGRAIMPSLEHALPSPMIGKPGSGVVGRLWQDAQHRDAWKLKDPTDADMARAQQFIELFYSGNFVNPTPRPIAGPMAQAQQISYAAPVPPFQQAQPLPYGGSPAAPVQAAPTAAIVPPPPPGFDPAAWLGLTDAQRAMFLGQAPTNALAAPTGY